MKASHALFFTISILIISFAINGCKEDDDKSVLSAATDTTAPTVISTSPADSSIDIAINTSILITFSEAMDTTSITANTTDAVCSGSLQLSSDDFSSCVQVSNPSAGTDKKVYTVQPASSLSLNTTYKIKTTTGVLDAVGNALGNDFVHGNGFVTVAVTASDSNTAVYGTTFYGNSNYGTQ